MKKNTPLVVTLSALLCGAGLAQAQGSAPSDLEQACNAQPTSSVLVAAASPALPAQAYWLARDLLSWPGKPAGTYKLYHSAGAQLVATVGQAVQGADGALDLQAASSGPAQSVQQRFKFVGAGALLRIADAARVPALLRQQLLLVQQDEAGKVIAATQLQNPGALDDLYAAAADVPDLGASLPKPQWTQFKLWAPTAAQVSLCVFGQARGHATAVLPMQRDDATGVWQAGSAAAAPGTYYNYLVDVVVPGVGLVRNRVTDPYAASLNADSRRTYVADMRSARLMPAGWLQDKVPAKVQRATDMVIYELHVRDFSINDASVAPEMRGKYMAFTQTASRGMRHLRALSQAGLTDVHLLPVFDIATIPEQGCTTPSVPKAAPDSEVQQAAVMAQAGRDCFNWGYDPYHFNAPEGSYASDADDGAVRIREFRAMVLALHKAGLRVGMDVVYNHMSASGQHEKSVLDRIVPGYYHRLNAQGVVERSTCCDNTATEHRMMAKLMLDSVDAWVRDYRIDSFRFDLMGHQPRAVMEQLQARVDKIAGRPVQLIGEGWNFGEIENGARFVQASQLSLNGSGIGTFSDRARDAVRGGRAGEGGRDLLRNQGYVNGMVYDANAQADAKPEDLLRTADMVRVGLAGSLRDFTMTDYQGKTKPLSAFDYAGQPAGYVSQPSEVVNYVENHDNQTLFDANAFKLPQSTSREDRARVQIVAAAINMFSQGIAYFHAGMETLRSKSLDGNSYDSGDWFNRLDWTFQDNYFGTGAPPKGDNGGNYAWIQPVLANADIKPQPQQIAWTRDAFTDLLRLRASSSLFRMDQARDIRERLRFFNTGPAQNPTVLVGHLQGRGYPGAGFREILYFVNVNKVSQSLRIPELQGRPFVLHPVQAGAQAADSRVRQQARYDRAGGRFDLPARSAVVFVVR